VLDCDAQPWKAIDLAVDNKNGIDNHVCSKKNNEINAAQA